MKIHYLSDLHLEFMPFQMQRTDANVVVLAGDIHIGIKGIKWALDNIKDCPVLYIAGNHEYYGNSYPKLIEKLRYAAVGTNLFILENNSILIEDTLFLGCTLWTDFELFGDFPTASYRALNSMMDFKKIRMSPRYSKIKPIDIAIAHNKSRKWLEEQFKEQKTKKIVIITHHAPSHKSIPQRYKSDSLTPAYASNLEWLIEKSNADVWIHGHIHDQVDYRISSTRVICNPRGYPDELNDDFDPKMTIDI